VNLRRVHPAEWLVGVFGLAIIAALILPWNGGEAAFESPDLLDVLLLLIAVMAACLPLVVASSARTNVPIVYETTLWPISLLLGIVLLAKAVFPPDGGFQSGFWLAFAATLAMSVSVWRSVIREH